MTKAYIPKNLQKKVSRTARYRCGYCQVSEVLLGMPMSFDHIIPEASGGTTSEENLWLACRRCNEFKGAQTYGKDLETGDLIALFNPREQVWEEHFYWDEEGTKVLAKTACGGATIGALNMNNPEIVVTRRHWLSVGWWPPQD